MPENKFNIGEYLKQQQEDIKKRRIHNKKQKVIQVEFEIPVPLPPELKIGRPPKDSPRPVVTPSGVLDNPFGSRIDGFNPANIVEAEEEKPHKKILRTGGS